MKIYDYDGKIFNKKGEVIEKALPYRGRETYYVAYECREGTHLYAYEYWHSDGRRIFYDGRKVRPLMDEEIRELIIRDQEKAKENTRKYIKATGTVELEKSDDKGWVML